MRDSARRLQERLEQLEAGEPLGGCLADLPEDEAELLETAVMLREVQYPARDRSVVAAQRANLLKLAAREKSMTSRSSHSAEKSSMRPRLKRLIPLAALSGAVTLLFICVCVAVIGAGFAWRSRQGTDVAQNPLPSPTPVVVARNPSPSPTPVVVAQTPSPSPTPVIVAQDPLPSPTSASEASPVQTPPPEATEEAAHKVYIPLISEPEIRDPQSAALKDVQGLVQVQAGDGTWTTVDVRRVMTAGQRIRTGALSSARLAFYDGSQVCLGPNTEISVDALDARPSDGPRIVVLTQWIGEADHDVVPADDDDSRYEVRTPSATGEAKGTSFHVVVASIQLSRFSVDEGSVAVTGLDVTVVVLAGQSTTIAAGGPPSPLAFHITGEGEVTQTGTRWIIAGQTFETDEGTVIIGHPQVGDRVSVEGRLLPDGTRLADRIVLLRRSPQNRFAITGRVGAMVSTTWTVAGQTIRVNDETGIEDDIESGDVVRVEGVILEGGSLLAERIRRIEEEPGLPFHFAGVVQEVAAEAWKISGVTIAVDTDTEVDAGLLIGDIVEVRGWILDDGTWLARSIERVEEDEGKFAFTGDVESIAPWVVSGIAFETREWTEIESGIDPGDRVRVKGRILEDGTWVASEIERFDDDNMASDVVFVGRVTSKDPWAVGNIPLVVNEETIIEGDISAGDLVRVRARILSDGTWLAKRIRRIGMWPGLGCLSFSAIVVGIDGDVLVLPNGKTVYLGEDVSIEGKVTVGSIIVVFICVDADGTITVVAIVVIYQPPPMIHPTPAPPAGDDDDKVTICHKPNSKNAHTITVSRSSVQSHLEHGDTLGPCSGHDDDHDDRDDDDDGD